jgi:hypothetical protein
LQRIAEPLRAGDPVLFAVPRPLPAEARAPVEAPATSPDAAEPTRAATLRRRPASNAATRTAPNVSAAEVSTTATANPPAPADTAAVAPAAIAPPPSRSVVATDDEGIAGRPPAVPPAEPRLRFAARAPNERATARPPASTAGSPADRAAAPHRLTSMWTATPSAPDVMSSDFPASETTAPDIIAPAARPVSAGIAAEPPPASISPPTPMATPVIGAAPAPRIHIGTVEVRTAPSPAAPVAASPARGAAAAPRGGTAPIARGYAWRFGLVQG